MILMSIRLDFDNLKVQKYVNSKEVDLLGGQKTSNSMKRDLTPSNINFPAFDVFLQLPGVKIKPFYHKNHLNCFLNNHN